MHIQYIYIHVYILCLLKNLIYIYSIYTLYLSHSHSLLAIYSIYIYTVYTVYRSLPSLSLNVSLSIYILYVP